MKNDLRRIREEIEANSRHREKQEAEKKAQGLLTCGCLVLSLPFCLAFAVIVMVVCAGCLGQL
jgi:hypothetical protein